MLIGSYVYFASMYGWAYLLNHGIGSLEISQDSTNIGLIIRPLLKGAETPLHGLHVGRSGGVLAAPMDVIPSKKKRQQLGMTGLSQRRAKKGKK